MTGFSRCVGQAPPPPTSPPGALLPMALRLEVDDLIRYHRARGRGFHLELRIDFPPPAPAGGPGQAVIWQLSAGSRGTDRR